MLKHHGATITEVLITLLVVSVGLLGLTALQLAQLRQISSANLHYLAQLQTQDIADRIRANPEGAANGSYSAITESPAEPSEGLCYTSSCNPTQLANVDAFEWNQNNARLLPNGAGTVTSPDNENFTITISWTRPDNTTDSRSFTLSLPN